MNIFKKYYGFHDNTQVQCTIKPDHIKIGGFLSGTTIPYTDITTSKGMAYVERIIGSSIVIYFMAKGVEHELHIRSFDISGKNVDGLGIYNYIIDKSAMSYDDKEKARNNISRPDAAVLASAAKAGMLSSSKISSKDASVVGRAVVGGVVAGPAGAVVGALSAVDKNNKKNSENK